MPNIFYFVVIENKWWSVTAASFVTVEPSGPDIIINNAADIPELIEILQYYGWPLGELTSMKEQYVAARAIVISQYEPLLIVSQETRTVLAMRAARNETKLDMVGTNYGETLALMKSEFDQIDTDMGTPIEATQTQPPFQANCHFCATKMELKSIWNEDTWTCPVCGRRVLMSEAIDTYLPENLASDFNAAVMHYLDLWAQQRGYDSIESAKQSATSTEFLQDGRAAVAAYDITWKYIIDNNLEAQVLAGTLTIDAAIAQLPVLSWEAPVVGPCGCKGPLAYGTITSSQSLIIQVNGLTFGVIRNDNPEISSALAALDPPVESNSMASLVIKATTAGQSFELHGTVDMSYSINGQRTIGGGNATSTIGDSWHIVASNLGRGDDMTLHALTTMEVTAPEHSYTVRVLTASTAPDTADICNFSVSL